MVKTLNFAPANPKQKGFLESLKKQILYSGAVGAGKSYMGCLKLVLFNMAYPGMRSLICRKEGTALKGSTLITLLEKVLPKELIVEHNELKGVIKHKTPVPGVYSTIVYSGLDKRAGEQYPQKIGSTEFGHIFVDEGIELDLGTWNMLVSRLRYQIPDLSPEQNAMIPRQITTATNPDAPTHWMYEHFFMTEDDQRQVFLTTPYENPFLPEDYIRTLENTYTGFYRDRLLLGKWVMAEGVIYASFDPRVHVSTEGFLKLSEYKELIIGADSNYPLPRAAVLIGIRGDSRIDLIEEFYREKSHVEDLMQWIEGLKKECGQNITVYHDPSDPSAIDKIGKLSRVKAEKAKNQVSAGIGSVAAVIDRKELVINASCKNTIKEIQGYRWASNKEGDVPVKEHDHACDSLRYAIYSYKERSQSRLLTVPEGLF